MSVLATGALPASMDPQLSVDCAIANVGLLQSEEALVLLNKVACQESNYRMTATVACIYTNKQESILSSSEATS